MENPFGVPVLRSLLCVLSILLPIRRIGDRDVATGVRQTG